MSPLENYDRVRRLLRRIFQLCGQDILNENYRRTVTSNAITIYHFTVVLLFTITTFDSEHYEASLRYTVGSFIFGALQVRVDIKRKRILSASTVSDINI